MGDIFSKIGGAEAGTAPAAGNTLGNIGSTLANSNTPTNPAQFDPNYGLVPPSQSFGDLIASLLQSIGQR
jgi:hypothetical protein